MQFKIKLRQLKYLRFEEVGKLIMVEDAIGQRLDVTTILKTELIGYNYRVTEHGQLLFTIEGREPLVHGIPDPDFKMVPDNDKVELVKVKRKHKLKRRDNV